MSLHEQGNSTQEPRKHHYVFAHQLIPNLLFGDTDDFLSILMSPQGNEFLVALWDELARRLEPEERLLPVGLRREPLKVGPDVAIRIDFPEVGGPAEARHSLILLQKAEEAAQVRYLTVERGVDDPAESIVGEWFPEGNRIHSGPIEISSKDRMAIDLIGLSEEVPQMWATPEGRREFGQLRPWPLDRRCVCGQDLSPAMFCCDPEAPLTMDEFTLDEATELLCPKCEEMCLGFRCGSCGQIHTWRMGVVESH